jgi:hypothetical protein
MSYLCLFISVVSMESIMVFCFISCVIRVLNSSMRDLRGEICSSAVLSAFDTTRTLA